MDQPDWARIQQIYDLALPLPPAERSAFIAKECRDNPALADEVNELLQAYESSGDFLESPLFQVGLKVISTAEDDLVGTIVDERYRVIQVLAEGGMGKLYLAEALKLDDKLVAIKVLAQTLLPDAEAERRFRQEVNVLTRVHHANVVDVLDAGKLPNGKPFVVMEYIDGVTLRSLIPSGGMDRKCAASILKEIGAALGHIHNQNIVHRDLKPENIMIEVSDDGTESVKIVDFGIAKVKDSVLTRTVDNVRIGTEAYMSPEQKLGGEITPASDIYTMALIAYEMINGKRPDQASMPVHRGRLSRKAYNLILQALSNEPSTRPHSAKQFGEDLSTAIATGWDLPTWLKVAAGVLFAALLSLLIYVNLPPTDPPGPYKFFDYWLSVQPMRGGQPSGNSFKSNGDDDIFGNGDRFQLNIRNDQSGYLYIYNEGPSGFRLIYPSKAINNGSASVGANQTVRPDWLTFSGPAGAENFWIVWSISPVNELESTKNEAFTQTGLSDQSLASVKEFLHKSNAKVDAGVTNYTKNRQETRVRARNDLVLTLVQFRHW